MMHVLLQIAGYAALVAAQPQIYPVTDAMRANAQQIIQAAVPSDGSTPMVAFERLAYMCDTFGPRFSGTPNLESALDWYGATAAADGCIVSTLPTTVPRWVRGTEYATMQTPRTKNLHILGLGGSIGTGPLGAAGIFQPITAAVVVINGSSPDEAYANMVLPANCASIAGKIVLFNVPFTTYGGTVTVRAMAGTWGVQCGAVAALIRTIGPFSIQSPHTGGTANSSIPAAAVSLEDATQMQRMQNRGQAVTVTLYMEGMWYDDVPSKNVIIDIPGTDFPNEYVLISGHCDSWDVSEGAMDDGGGAIGTLEAMRLLSSLGIRGKRTIRGVCWTNEENGARGGQQYASSFASLLANHSLVVESDEGAFTPYALAFTGHPWAKAQLALLGELLVPIGAGSVSDNGGGTDIGPMTDLGVPSGGMAVLDPRLSPYPNSPCTDAWVATPGAGPMSQDLNSALFSPGYFMYHHTTADTVDRMDPHQLNRAAAFLAVWAVAVADLPAPLPRDCLPLQPPCPAPPLPPTGAGSAASAPTPAALGGAIGGFVAVLFMGAAVFYFRPSLVSLSAISGSLRGVLMSRSARMTSGYSSLAVGLSQENAQVRAPLASNNVV